MDIIQFRRSPMGHIHPCRATGRQMPWQQMCENPLKRQGSRAYGPLIRNLPAYTFHSRTNRSLPHTATSVAHKPMEKKSSRRLSECGMPRARCTVPSSLQKLQVVNDDGVDVVAEGQQVERYACSSLGGEGGASKSRLALERDLFL